jgi:signal transduction histidine kinase
MESKTEQIRTRILVPVALALFIMLMVSIISIYWLQQRKMMQDINHEIMEVNELFPRFLKTEGMLMESLIDSLKENENLKYAWIIKDRELLLQHAMRLFPDIKSRYNITHFYFIDLERDCFLRVHNPERYGDSIDRFTLKQAIRQGTSTYGIELGPFGTFTLRVVQPWKIQGKLVGYIELGKEIDHIGPAMKKILGVELFFVIDKKFLSRRAWEEGLRMIEQPGDWDKFPDVVIAYQSIEAIPPNFISALSSSHEEHTGLIFKTKISGHNYRGGFLPLVDAGGNSVGDIIILNDTTEDEASSMMSLLMQIAFCGVVIILLFSFFYSYVGRVQQRLLKASNDLMETQEALYRKERLAELGQLASGVGHELRNPMGVIKNACYFLNMKMSAIEDETVKDNINIIKRETNTADKIVSNILNFSRTKKPERQDVNIDQLVTDTLSRFSIPGNITVSTDFSGDLGPISLDPIQVGQIFFNLIENAMHAMKDGGTLKIEIRQQSTMTEVVFVDSGSGIAAENLEKIFEPLFTSKQKGVGLGLAVSKSFAEANGGTILAESIEGNGSKFTVRFSGDK